MWNPFRRPSDPPRLLKRIENLELRSADLEDTIEKVMHQQTRMMGKINARHKQTLADAEAALEAAPAPSAAPAPPNDVAPSPFAYRDAKAEMRAQAALLRGRR